MWQVLEHRRVVRRRLKTPAEVLKRYEKWKDIVTISGPPGLRAIKGFHDESLSGDWKGYRSSGLGAQFRVIYKVEAQKVSVMVLDLTTHDYRRKGK